MPNAFLGKLITLNKKCNDAGGHAVLCNVDPEIMGVFQLTRFDKVIAITKTEQEALQLLGSGAAQGAGDQKGDAAGGSALDRLKQERQTPQAKSI